MKHVAPVRRKLGVPTIFNLLGPLCNPASAPFQLLGVGRPRLRPLLSAAIALLGTRRTVVLCGDDGLDEVTLGGTTRVTIVTAEGIEEGAWQPQDFRLAAGELTTLRVDGPDGSARMIREILSGKPGLARDIVVMNSAAALWVAGHADSLADGAVQAAEAIDSDGAAGTLDQLVRLSQHG
jgi:anthranilate phosphoribosyltransferase